MVLKALEIKELGRLDYCIYMFILEPFYKKNKADEYEVYIYKDIYDEDTTVFKVMYKHYIISCTSSKDCLKLNTFDITKNKTYNKISFSYTEEFSFTTMKKLIDLEIQTIL